MSKKPIAKGITAKSNGKFEARLKYKGSTKRGKLHSIYIGVYDTVDEAVEARIDFIDQLY